jgi:hypothetical protein
MSGKQTAVEWLREQLTFEYEGELLSSNHEDKNLKTYFEQALEMEREQIEEAQPCTCTPDETTGATQFPGEVFKCNICGKEAQP